MVFAKHHVVHQSLHGAFQYIVPLTGNHLATDVVAIDLESRLFGKRSVQCRVDDCIADLGAENIAKAAFPPVEAAVIHEILARVDADVDMA